ncbi:MAG: flagellin lysine-N-methylase [Lachnospiraceae bacterium]|nr:flagellin lysine-N-methylase [Lachnospiraceae bacterium]
MDYIYPEYYKKFECIAGSCPDTCCAGWKIMIDDKSLKKYKKYKGDFGNRLVNCIEWKEGAFHQYDKRCAFLDENNLCDIYSEAGKEYLCKTCRRYPRHYEEFENIREISLSLSCPVAAKIILKEEGLPKMITAKRDMPAEEYEFFDFLLYTKLIQLRELYFEVLGNKSYTLNYKMAFLLATAHDVQTRINKNEIFEIDNLIEKYSAPDFYKEAKRVFSKYSNVFEKGMNARRDIFDNLFLLEILNEEWTPFLRECRDNLYSKPVDLYIREKEEFEADYLPNEQQYINLLHYFVYVYMCGAVYDDDLYTKIRFAIVNVLNIVEIDNAVWKISNRVLDFERQNNIVYRYSREVEHSDLNLKYMEELISKGKEYSYERLLNAILMI